MVWLLLTKKSYRLFSSETNEVIKTKNSYALTLIFSIILGFAFLLILNTLLL